MDLTYVHAVGGVFGIGFRHRGTVLTGLFTQRRSDRALRRSQAMSQRQGALQRASSKKRPGSTPMRWSTKRRHFETGQSVRPDRPNAKSCRATKSSKLPRTWVTWSSKPTFPQQDIARFARAARKDGSVASLPARRVAGITRVSRPLRVPCHAATPVLCLGGSIFLVALFVADWCFPAPVHAPRSEISPHERGQFADPFGSQMAGKVVFDTTRSPSTPVADAGCRARLRASPETGPRTGPSTVWKGSFRIRWLVRPALHSNMLDEGRG